MSIRTLRGIEALWRRTYGRSEIRVAILDGAADLSHPAFAGAEVSVSALDDAAPPTQHGTQVASIVFGQQGSPAEGIAPAVSGVLFPIFREVNGILQPSNQVALANAISRAVAAGAHIINISAGELDNSGEPDFLLKKALQSCEDHNVLVVAAAGNDSCKCLHVPAASPNVLAVGASDADGNPMGFSNFGEQYLANGILTLGRQIRAAVPGNTTTEVSGTSFAAPIVTGVAALLLSIQVEKGQPADPLRIKKLLMQAVDPCDPELADSCEKHLLGNLNPEKALQLLDAIEHTQSQNNLIAQEDMSNPNESQLEQQPTLPSVTLPEASPEMVEPAYDEVVTASAVTASDCGCGNKGGECSCGGKKKASEPELVYAIGQLSVDLVNDARRDSLAQHIDANPEDPTALLAAIKKEPYLVGEFRWTLHLDDTPVYVIQAHGPYAAGVNNIIAELLANQLDGKIDRVSVPGYNVGNTTLRNGQEVPVIVPVPRGLAGWSTHHLVQAVTSGKGAKKKEADVTNFLERVYHELRNLGITPADRAINHAATNAFQANSVFHTAIDDGMELSNIEVEKSPIARPGADNWDVKLTFFDPKNRMERARKVYRFTVDVSDAVPVTVGEVRSWSVY